MIGIVLAAAVPAVLFWAGTRGKPDVHRAVTFWFAPLALLFFVPCWMTGRTPAPLDYLAEDVVPWQIHGYQSRAPLLSDSALQFLPWRESIKDAVLHGSMPFLDRYNGSGSALWANPQSGATSPLTWIGLPFSTEAWPLFAAMMKVLAALTGMYLFLRREESSHTAAIYGAVAYAFCAFNIAFVLFPHTNVTVLLPWVLLGIAEGNSIKFAIALALMLTGGHPESVLHAAFIAIPYALWRRKHFGRIAAGGVVALLLAAPALVPFAEYLPMSERVARLARQPEILLEPPMTWQNLTAYFAAWNLRSTIDANLLMNFNEVATQYAGLLTFILSIVAAILDAKRQRFWIAMTLVASFFAFESPVARAITSHIPIVNVTVHGRLRFVIAFCMAVLAAKAVDRMAGRIAIIRPALPLIVFADLAALLMFYNAPVHPPGRTPAVQFLESHRGPHRVVGIANALRPNTASYLKIESIGFHDPMAFEPYGAALASAGYDRRTYFNVFPTIPPRGVLNALGVRYVIAAPHSAAGELVRVYDGADATIFENPAALPRAFTATPGATVAIGDYEANSETMTIRSQAPVRIATSEIALPGWRLTLNGERKPIVVLRNAFIGFEGPPGETRARLRYIPQGFEPGCWLFIVGLGALPALSRFNRIRAE